MLYETHIAGGRDKNANEFAEGEILFYPVSKSNVSPVGTSELLEI